MYSQKNTLFSHAGYAEQETSDELRRGTAGV